MKVHEEVIERRIREQIDLHENQVGFRPERGTADIHIETGGKENLGRKQQEPLDLCWIWKLRLVE